MTPKEGRVSFVDLFLGLLPGTMFFHLAKADPSPADENITLADLTEATFAGYSPITGVSFPSGSLNGSNQGESTSPTLTWTSAGGVSGSETIYGIYMTFGDTSTGARLLQWFPFASPITISMDGQTIEKKVKILMDNLVP